MNSVFSYRATIDLRTKQNEVFWDTIANVGDKGAHQFVLNFIDAKGKDVDLTGASVSLYCIRPDNETVYIEGGVEDNCAVVALTDQCYAYTGRVKCTVTVSKNGALISAVRVWITIGIASTDAIVDPGEVIPSLADLLAEIATMRTATSAANTATANANTATASANSAASSANTAASNANSAASSAQAATQSAKSAAQTANSAANAINSLTATATGISAGSAPTVTVTEVDGHKNIAFEIPKGDTGATGATGAKGDTGDAASVTSTVVYFQNSTDGTTIPTETWVTTQPSTPQGEFLWIRIHKVWNSGQETDEYSVSRMGIDGSGSVRTVMGIDPDISGDVSLSGAVTVVSDTLHLNFV